MLRLVMMGTGEFALPAFRTLYESGHEVAALFTQPDRAGRGHHHHPHPMKDEAVARGTPVFQPENVNRPESLAELRKLEADVFVVAAYGQILSPELLSIPKWGAINLHASLLPKYRGAAPVQYAVWMGETETGVTIFRIEPRLDAGPILAVARTPIEPKETAGELEKRLAALAAPLLLNTLGRIETGNVEELPQDRSAVTKAPRLKKSDGRIDWSLPPERIERHVLAMQPWPTPYSFLVTHGHDPLRLLVLEVEPVEWSPSVAPGTVVEVTRDWLVVQAGHGAVELVRVQPSGKRAMSAAEFLCGHMVHVGDRFDATPRE
ncbi:MAG: methionyl-tRNA formyltransferase [Planctomycetales bacterium]